MIVFWAIFGAAVLLGALAWRIRGGFLGLPSTQLGRAVPSALAAGWAYWLTGDLLMLCIGPLVLAGITFPWAQWQDMGHVEDNDDFVGMAGRGALLGTAAGIYMEFLGYHGLAWAVSQELMAVWYWLAWKLGKDIRLGGFIDGAAAIGELLTGAWLIASLGIWLTLI